MQKSEFLKPNGRVVDVCGGAPCYARGWTGLPGPHLAAAPQISNVSSAMPPLPLLVFVVGTGSLGAEIAAVRLLAPYFGASTIVWANTIGIVLVALSLGYWLGGRLADRHPNMRGLCLLALVAAALLALVPFAADPLLDVAVDALDEISAGAFLGSLAAVLVLVAVPVLLLGAVSPWAIRLAVSSVEEAGRGGRPPLRPVHGGLAAGHAAVGAAASSRWSAPGAPS